MFTYKEIEKDDLAALAAMYVETFNAPPWNDAWSQETAEIRLRQMAEAKTFYGICAFEGEMLCGMIFGFAEQFYDGVLFEIKEFCVKNASRGNGIGSAIYREFEKRLRERNIKEILGDDFSFSINYCDSIQKSKNGKLKQVVNLIK